MTVCGVNCVADYLMMLENITSIKLLVLVTTVQHQHCRAANDTTGVHFASEQISEAMRGILGESHSGITP